MIYRLSSIFSCTLFLSFAVAQIEEGKEQTSTFNLESSFEYEEMGVNQDFLISTEKQAYFRTHPININKAKESVLRESGVFEERELALLLMHRKKYGDFVEKEELLSIPSFPKKRFDAIAHYITTKDEKTYKNITLKEGNHLVLIRNTTMLEKQEGYKNDNFQGDTWQHYLRYKYQVNQRLGWGFTLEKDEGESLNKNQNRLSLKEGHTGFDYQSAHFFYKHPQSFLKEVYIGDYGLNMGQGIHFWNGMSFRKSANSVEIKRSKSNIFPYRSSNEWDFLRGIAIKLGGAKVNVIGFYSMKHRDANLSEDSITNTLLSTGLHRTNTEIESKQLLRENIFGVRIGYQKTRFQSALTYSHTLYGHSLRKQQALYNRYAFEGSELSLASLDIRWIGTHIEYFSEHVFSSKKEHAHLNGLDFYVSDDLKLSLCHRYYSRGFFAPYGKAFGDRLTNQNEIGVYAGLRFYPMTSWSITAYYDLYTFPWSSYHAIAPVDGRQYSLRISHNMQGRLDMYWGLRRTKENKNVSSRTIGLRANVETQYTQLRYHLNCSLSEQVLLKNRLELVKWKTVSQNHVGFLIYQDIQFKEIKKIPLTLTFRIAFADIDSYDSRIYAYENDVLYTFSFASFNEELMRYYLMLYYKLSRHFKIWIRFSRTSLANPEATFGSGNQLIRNNQKSRLRFQMMYQF